MKIKSLIQNFIFSQRSWVAHVLIKAKTALIETLEETRRKNIHVLVPFIFKKNRNRNKLYLGSFRFHYHWSPSYVIPQSSIHDRSKGYVYYDPKQDSYDGSKGYVYYDPKRDSYEEDIAVPSLELTGYLHWLEEKDKDSEITEINEIDDLAEKYIANCHKKFILEKQESDRKYQEMMARSL